jgi:hypothetical protein
MFGFEKSLEEIAYNLSVLWATKVAIDIAFGTSIPRIFWSLG